MRGSLTLAVTAGLSLAACSAAPTTTGGSPGSDDGGTLTVGIVNSYTGVLASFGPAWEAGYRAGIDVLTDGTSEVNGVTIDIQVRNDNGEPAVGTNAARELLGAGAQMIVGTSSSAVIVPMADLVDQNEGIFIAGTGGTPAIDGLGPGTFRSGWNNNQLIKGVVAMAEGGGGESIVHLGQDYANGQTQAEALTRFGGEAGLDVTNVLLPPDTQDFTPGVAQVVAAQPDLIYASWAGSGSVQLFQALQDQGVFAPDSGTSVVTVGPNRSDFDAFASAVGPEVLQSLRLTTQYAEDTTGTDAEADMLGAIDREETPVDFQHAGGYLAALMTVRLIEELGTDLTPEGADEVLAGETFETVVGSVTVRPEDHVNLVPVFEYRMVEQDGEHVLELTETYQAEDVTPEPGTGSK